jgi:hypothetical protein
MKTLVCFNTIGLSGTELIIEEVSKLKGINILPGQNFVAFENCLYRVHDYKNYVNEDIFSSLNKTLVTKNGRVWMGLTKFMTSEQNKKYDLDLHRKLFLKKELNKKDFLSLVHDYISAYFESNLIDNNFEYLGFFGANFLLNIDEYTPSSNKVKLINVKCSIGMWLSLISQTKTWNIEEAIKYWIVFNLFSEINYSTKKIDMMNVSFDVFLEGKKTVVNDICNFLKLKNTNGNEVNKLGFVKPTGSFMEKVISDQKDIEKIYKNNFYFKMAETFDNWKYKAIGSKELVPKFKELEKFWNSTYHTNLDWIGPIGENILECCVRMPDVEVTTKRSINERFYQEYFILSADTYNSPIINLHHGLGYLESEIIIPKLRYFIKIAISYLDSILANAINNSHSYSSLHGSSVYQKLSSDDYKVYIERFGLLDQFNTFEKKLFTFENGLL